MYRQNQPQYRPNNNNNNQRQNNRNQQSPEAPRKAPLFTQQTYVPEYDPAKRNFNNQRYPNKFQNNNNFRNSRPSHYDQRESRISQEDGEGYRNSIFNSKSPIPCYKTKEARASFRPPNFTQNRLNMDYRQSRQSQMTHRDTQNFELRNSQAPPQTQDPRVSQMQQIQQRDLITAKYQAALLMLIAQALMKYKGQVPLSMLELHICVNKKHADEKEIYLFYSLADFQVHAQKHASCSGHPALKIQLDYMLKIASSAIPQRMTRSKQIVEDPSIIERKRGILKVIFDHLFDKGFYDPKFNAFHLIANQTITTERPILNEERLSIIKSLALYTIYIVKIWDIEKPSFRQELEKNILSIIEEQKELKRSHLPQKQSETKRQESAKGAPKPIEKKTRDSSKQVGKKRVEPPSALPRAEKQFKPTLLQTIYTQEISQDQIVDLALEEDGEFSPLSSSPGVTLQTQNTVLSRKASKISQGGNKRLAKLSQKQKKPEVERSLSLQCSVDKSESEAQKLADDLLFPELFQKGTPEEVKLAEKSQSKEKQIATTVNQEEQKVPQDPKTIDKLSQQLLLTVSSTDHLGSWHEQNLNQVKEEKSQVQNSKILTKGQIQSLITPQNQAPSSAIECQILRLFESLSDKGLLGKVSFTKVDSDCLQIRSEYITNFLSKFN
ncbi:hypothetical protein FGO68_gene6282 [Halteria grandinella]|uniref:Uncharacterized protein n=1 Tax=Halteria grandinella TaxID=5974 RepID=A0A8J8NY68_HALGN|nr:hypothetical protein FGO68_gene6282 [Halteria grandinella]